MALMSLPSNASDSDGKSVICSVQNVSVRYERWGQGVRALNDVSLDVRRGEWLMLVGANGSGKSTLLKAIGGRLTPTQGHVRIDGKPIQHLKDSALAEQVFLVRQDPLLGTAPTLTVLENLRVADEVCTHSDKEHLVSTYAELLSPIGLEDRLEQPVEALSGGERQLLALLVARLRSAPLVLLDESLAALDPEKTRISLRQIAGLQASGKTLIQVTHRMEQATKNGNRTVVLRDGSIRQILEGKERTLRLIQSAWHNKSPHAQQGHI